MSLQIVIVWVINCSHVYEMTQRHCDISVSNVSLGNKDCHFTWHVNPERSQLGMLHDWQLVSILQEAPILFFLHDYACSKIRIVVAIHGSWNLIESIPFDMNNSLDIPGDGFWCQKDGHLPNCFSLKSILQFIRQQLANTLLVYKSSFGNKQTILMTNVATSNNII